ncbi:Oidioi.mRNA.OKI2018_I69.chr2.g8116.t1.cds [Oikopleura dioica]|uniref:Carbohydrate sulfotransferase n=1 Tax=Oikopleura dioica TaxID=34765 RepID=A0ABN7TDZ5_OIKDI|nr:Oidioi.mRNA.OKI2018_I69.chr2.g8116.t1.cds [Oikopleura dioica]
MIDHQKLKKIFCCIIVAGIATVLIQITSQSVSTKKIIQAKQAELTLNQTEFSDLQMKVHGRSKHLKKICSEMKEKGAKFSVSDYVKERLLVDLEKKILFCPIPKAGSSNWKRIFAKLTTENYDEVDDLLEIRKVHHIQLPVLSDFSGEKQKKILKDFRKSKQIQQPLAKILGPLPALCFRVRFHRNRGKLPKEAELLVRTLNITVTFPEHEAKTTAESSLEVFGSLSKAYLAKLYNIYKIDFAIFNYTIDHFVQLTKS